MDVNLINMFLEMSTSDKISSIVSIITFGGIITSLIISVITLMQNNQFKREEIRASIVCYIEHITKTANSYIIIKNFGKSIGKVINIKLDPEVKLKKILGIQREDFKTILEQKNFILAPNQKICSAFNFMHYKIDPFKVIIEYETLGKIYKEEYDLIPNITHSVTSIEKSKSGRNEQEQILDRINESLKEISEKI